jgi:hypothetical protein
VRRLFFGFSLAVAGVKADLAKDEPTVKTRSL